MINSLFYICGEPKPSFLNVVLYQLFQLRLVNGDYPLPELVYLFTVHIHAHDIIACLCKTGT